MSENKIKSNDSFREKCFYTIRKLIELIININELEKCKI